MAARIIARQQEPQAVLRVVQWTFHLNAQQPQSRAPMDTSRASIDGTLRARSARPTRDEVRARQGRIAHGSMVVATAPESPTGSS